MAASGNIEGLMEHAKSLTAARDKRKDKLLKLLENPDVTRKLLKANLGVNTDTLRGYMRELHREERLPEGSYERFRAQGRSRRRIPGSIKEAKTPKAKPRKRKKPLSPKEELNRKRWNRLLHLMRENPSITVPELAEKLGVCIWRVERDRTALHRKGRISGRGPKTHVVDTIKMAQRQLKLKRLAGLLQADPTLKRPELAEKIGINATSIYDYVQALIERGDLPCGFCLTRGNTRSLKVQEEMKERRPVILEGIANGISKVDIAGLIGCTPQRLYQDIKAMRKAEDPGLAEAERLRDQLRPPRPPPKPRDLTKKAIANIERLFDEPIEEINFRNMVVFNADTLEELDGRWEENFTSSERRNLKLAGVVYIDRGAKLSEKAKLILEDYRAGRLEPLIIPDSYDKHEPPFLTN